MKSFLFCFHVCFRCVSIHFCLLPYPWATQWVSSPNWNPALETCFHWGPVRLKVHMEPVSWIALFTSLSLWQSYCFPRLEVFKCTYVWTKSASFLLTWFCSVQRSSSRAPEALEMGAPHCGTQQLPSHLHRQLFSLQNICSKMRPQSLPLCPLLTPPPHPTHVSN